MYKAGNVCKINDGETVLLMNDVDEEGFYEGLAFENNRWYYSYGGTDRTKLTKVADNIEEFYRKKYKGELTEQTEMIYKIGEVYRAKNTNGVSITFVITVAPHAQRYYYEGITLDGILYSGYTNAGIMIKLANNLNEYFDLREKNDKC